jgi:O-antigen/teichoic acid export membrane protein
VRQVASGAIWVSLETWVNQVLRFLVFVLLARMLGPEPYGILTLALVVVTFAEVVISEGGWSEALIRKHPLLCEDLDTVFWFSVVASVVLAGSAFACAMPLAYWFETPEIGRVLPWLACGLPFTALRVVPNALLEREFKFQRIALSSLIGTLVGGLGALMMAVLGYGIWSLILYYLLESIIRSSLLWALCPWVPGTRVCGASLLSLLRFVSGTISEVSLSMLDAGVARALIGSKSGVIQVGYYGLAQESLVLIRRMLVAPVTRVALPAITTMRSEPERLGSSLNKGLQLAMLFALPGSIGLIIVAPDVVILLVGSKWTPAITAVQTILLLGPIMPLIRLNVTLQLALGRARLVAGLAVLSTTLFLLAIICVRSFSAEAVLEAFVLRTYVLLPLHLALLWRSAGINPLSFMRAMWPALVCCLVMGSIVLLIRARMPADTGVHWRLIASVVLGVLVYALITFIVARPLVVDGFRLLRGTFRLDAS